MPLLRPTLPNYVPPVDTSKPTAEEINKLEQYSNQTVAAANSSIPVVYGRDRLFGKVFVLHVDETLGFLYVGFGFCVGEILAFEKVYVDGKDVTEPGGLLSFADAAMNTYTGTTSQGVDPLLEAVIDGYADAPKIAYVVLKVPRGASQGFPRCEAIIQGKKVYDPRKDTTQNTLSPVGLGSHRLNDPSTWEYSVCPALCYADLAVNYAGYTVNWQSIVDTANANDQIVGTGNNQQSRREIGLSLLNPETIESWNKVFRMYMGAYITWEDGIVRLIPDKKEIDISYALSFDGTDSRVTIQNTSAFNFGSSQSFCVELNHRLTLVPIVRAVLVGKKTTCTGNDAGWCLYINSTGRVVAVLADGTTSYTKTSTDPLTLNQPVHIAVNCNRGTNELTLLLDGVQDGAAVSIAGLGSLDNTRPLRFGENDGG